jgi:hypothetical protein
MNDALAAVSDADLLAAIRRGDVSAVSDRVTASAGYFERDDALRAEAVRRGIL